MLEGIVHPRHLRELDRPFDVVREPERLEVHDVPQIPEDRAHQGIVLAAEILLAHGRDELQCTLACIAQPFGENAGELGG